MIAASSVGEAFGSGAQPDAAGVFLDDGTMSKIDYFLHVGMTTTLSCDQDPATATVTIDLTADTPDTITTMPWYVAGDRAGITQTNLTIYSPVGGRVLGVESGGVALASARSASGGREAVAVTTVLAPGASPRWSCTWRCRRASVARAADVSDGPDSRPRRGLARAGPAEAGSRGRPTG